MKHRCIIVAAAFITLGMSGCATKHYGRQGVLTTPEKATMTCREIELEQAKVDGFLETVNRESSFDGKDVLAFLGDFGIGNSMEKSAAINSAMVRKSDLQGLYAAKACKATAP